MKRFILILIAALLTASMQASDSLYISLLTCTQGRDVSSAFGHSAIRVKDCSSGTDIVYNYGTFSFEEPHFFLKFLRGDLNYCLSTSYFDNFKRSYEAEGRGITEQPFNISEEQKKEIRKFLRENARPENRFYLYDFLQDNCATRIRDIFDKRHFSISDTLVGETYRDELKRMVGDKRWMMFGIDLLLGARVDREITVREAMFLPDRLSAYLKDYVNEDAGGIPLMTESSTICSPSPGPGKFLQTLSRLTSPFTVFTLLFLFYLIFFMAAKDKWKFSNIFSTVLYIVLGTGGIILCLMWFATNHIWTAANWNLIWMNPLYLVPAFLPQGTGRNIAINILTSVSVLGLIFMWLIPQSFNLAVPIIIMLLALVALSRRSLSYNH